MAEPQKCPECGAELPQEAPQGLCPQCLLKEGLREDSEQKDDLAQAETRPFLPGAP